MERTLAKRARLSALKLREREDHLNAHGLRVQFNTVPEPVDVVLFGTEATGLLVCALRRKVPANGV